MLTFILGVVPLILASGAGASARKSLGVAVASGMIASTCLAVVFVPSHSTSSSSAGRNASAPGVEEP